MKLWKRASGALKDRNSVLIASLSRRTTYRNPNLEAAIIKATSHDETRVDYKNAKRVFAWVRTSPSYLKPLIWALSTRMEKSRSWVVVLKGLMLMHGVFCCRVPGLQKIGRLPFDLSNFNDGYSNSTITWGYNAFVRAYFAFLDQKSGLLNMEYYSNSKNQSMMEQLQKLQQCQALLHILLQVKPVAEGITHRTRPIGLILEAMDCVIIEIFDVYSRICSGIASVLTTIYGAGKVEAAMALEVLQKATVQGDELSLYFEFCREIGVLNASEFPKVEKIPEEDIKELKRIINGVSEKEKTIIPRDQDKALMMVKKDEQEDSKSVLKTVITEKWEVFDEDLKMKGGFDFFDVHKTTYTEDPFAPSFKVSPPHVNAYNQGIPDLISFL